MKTTEITFQDDNDIVSMPLVLSVLTILSFLCKCLSNPSIIIPYPFENKCYSPIWCVWGSIWLRNDQKVQMYLFVWFKCLIRGGVTLAMIDR